GGNGRARRRAQCPCDSFVSSSLAKLAQRSAKVTAPAPAAISPQVTRSAVRCPPEISITVTNATAAPSRLHFTTVLIASFGSALLIGPRSSRSRRRSFDLFRRQSAPEG